MREVLVLCYGNICRSPIMEVLLQGALDDRFGVREFLVSGAGIGADDGRPPSQGSIRAMSARGIDLRRYRSRALTASIARSAWRIYAAEAYQVEYARKHLPPERHDRVQLLGGEEIPDPLGSTQEAYEAVAAQVERLVGIAVDEIAVEVAGERGNGPR